MSKPRILILENSTVVTGAMKAVITSTSYLRSSFSFQFIIPAGSSTRSSYLMAGFNQVHEWKMTELSKRPGALLLYLPRLVMNGLRMRKLVKQQGIDLIHVNDL